MPLAGRDLDDLWSGLNQEWRRNIKKAAKSGVETVIGTADYLGVFHDLLRLTEQCDGFRLGRSLEYFHRQYQKLNDGKLGAYAALHLPVHRPPVT